MKNLIIILLIFITIGAKAQIVIDSSKVLERIPNEWVTHDTVTQFMGNPEQEDTVCYVFSKIPDVFKRNDLEGSAGRLQDFKIWTGNGSEIGDTILHYRKTMRVELLRSFKAVRKQLITGKVWVKKKNTDDEVIEKVVRKKFQLGIKNNATVWNYPLVYDITNPSQDTIVIDTTE